MIIERLKTPLSKLARALWIRTILNKIQGKKTTSKTKYIGMTLFFAALQLELHDYKDVLTFEDEHQLSKEALKMDVLIIKKTADVKIDKNIGRIFRNHNIFEYKSEMDNLSVWDYNKSYRLCNDILCF
ncbi:MAG: hypothetical protein FWG63_08085 [Defluviitaleaceae bacterium]|nr:hypothetical protein [Defluviitaleaceae bacterium]